MKRWLKILAIGVVLAVAGTYAIYAMEYKGNYNLTASFTLNVDQYGGVAIAGFTYDSEPTGMAQFWEQFKGHSAGDEAAAYMVYWELNQSGVKTTFITSSGVIDYGTSKVMSLKADNLDPGTGAIKVTIRDSHTTILLERSFDVVIG